jgi:hypothetical protein
MACHHARYSERQSLGFVDRCVFKFKKMPFSFQAAGEAMQASVFSHDPMTRNDDGNGVAACGRPGGVNGLGCNGPFGQIGVSDGFSVRNERDLPPDFFLKIGAGQVHRK